MGDDTDRLQRIVGLVPGLRHRADNLAGTGTSVAADELRHVAVLIEGIANGTADHGQGAPEGE